MWDGDYAFVLQNLVLKDFKVRYRNMSLGFLWSLLNPLVMMALLSFVFTRIFPNPSTESFPIFVLCGLIPFNFFSLAWSSATTSLLENETLVKKVLAPRELVPIAAVLSSCIHLLIQLALLAAIAVVWGKGLHRHWLWIPLLCGFEIAFVCGLGLVSSAVDLYIRDTRYVVDSAVTVLFWLVPIFYSLSFVPEPYREIYQWNPIAAVVLSVREVVLEATAPPPLLVARLAATSLAALVLGRAAFRLLERRFHDFL